MVASEPPAATAPAEEELPDPPARVPTPEEVQGGKPMSPQQHLGLYNDSEWEAFVVEWAHSLKARYKKVRRLGSAGDQGRDVVAYVTDDVNSERDVFQCKHYADALSPSVIAIEIGKLLWFTFKKIYTPPRHYFFVAPKGCGTKLSKLLEKPDELRAYVVEEWDDKCRDKITETAAVALDGTFRKYVDAFDFSTIRDLAPHEVIEDHRKTPHFLRRFGGGLPPLDRKAIPPAAPAPEEAGYLKALLDAYSEHLEVPTTVATLMSGSECGKHLIRSREEFYDAELLKNFSRDQLGEAAYEALLDQVENGIADVVDGHATNGFARVKEATRIARALILSADPHDKRFTTKRRAGACHQLANDGRVVWVKK
jgi:hypothetical protein